MAKVKDCPGFETFGKDVQTAREALACPAGRWPSR